MQIYGIDLAMEKFDVNYIDIKGNEKHLIVNNKMNLIIRFLETIPKDSIICAEYTGVYGNMLLYLSN